MIKLLSDSIRWVVVLACVAGLLIAGCQDTTTREGGNGPVISAAATAPRSASPQTGGQNFKQPQSQQSATPALPLGPAQPTVTPDPPVPAPEAIALTPPKDIRSGVRVGLLLPLSGPRRDVGRALLGAAMLAMFDIANRDFVLVPVDTKSTLKGAAMAAEEVLAAEVKLVIGPVFSDAVQVAAAPIQKAGLNMLVFSNDRAVAKAGVYLSGLLPETQVDRIVRYAAKRGLKRIAAILPQGPFGVRVSDALRETAADRGMEVTRIREYGTTPEQIAKAVRGISDYDYRRGALLEQRAELKGREDEGSRRALARLEILETIGSVPFDALLVAASGDNLVNVAAQLGNYDIDPKRTHILGTADWAAENIGREPSLVGAWFATPPVDAAADFTTKFSKIYGKSPPTIASSAYDLVSLAAILGSQEGVPRFDRKTLTSETGFKGVGGLFRFLNSGLVERSLEIRKVQTRGNRVIDPALKRFENSSN